MLNAKLNKPQDYLPYFMLLLALFLFRVASQLLQYFFNLPFLPPYESWDSDTLPYGLLIVIQLFIVFLFSKIVYKIYSDKIRPNAQIGYSLIAIGTFYFVVMLFRLIGGLTLLQDIKWFTYPIPSFFHLVLASFIILFGYVHLSISRGESTNA